MFNDFIQCVRTVYNEPEAFIPLHAPVFLGKEKAYLGECIDTTFVSSVGKFVDKIEQDMKEKTGAAFAVAVVNGTAALHMALILSGVGHDDEVLTQSVSFVATVNAIRYCGAWPVFVDIDRDTLGLSPEALDTFLSQHAVRKEDGCYNKYSGKRIAACVPMHTFGHSARIQEIIAVCDRYGIPVVEDAAEALGSYNGSQHLGTFGKLGTFSFNGNKIVTTGGGGIIVTNDVELGKKAKHITTTAKIPHPWHYTHDDIGYNYRMPNINAALGCAQLEYLDVLLEKKRRVAETYSRFFDATPYTFFTERAGTTGNYWLNAVLLNNAEERDAFLKETNAAGIMTRPIWTPLHKLAMFESCQTDLLENTLWLEDRLVNIPSSVPLS